MQLPVTKVPAVGQGDGLSIQFTHSHKVVSAVAKAAGGGVTSAVGGVCLASVCAGPPFRPFQNGGRNWAGDETTLLTAIHHMTAVLGCCVLVYDFRNMLHARVGCSSTVITCLIAAHNEQSDPTCLTANSCAVVHVISQSPLQMWGQSLLRGF